MKTLLLRGSQNLVIIIQTMNTPVIVCCVICVFKATAASGLNKIGVGDVDVAGKRVLMRVDFNVPMDGKRITNTQVIWFALWVLKECESLILISIGHGGTCPN